MATRKGDQAKQTIINKIAETFGQDFAGVVDKKLYVWVNDGTERVQIAISLTMPKTPVSGNTRSENAAPWEDSPTDPAPACLSEEDKEKVNELMEKLGLK